MVNKDDFITKSNRRWYRCTCDKCGKDRGYKRSSKIQNLCKSCSHRKVPDLSLYSNVDANQSIIDSAGFYRVKTSCLCCGKDKGYTRLTHIHKLCLSCSRRKHHEKSTQQDKDNLSKRVSCSKRGILAQDFDGCITPIVELERSKFKNQKLHNECFRLANFTCDKCGSYGNRLNAHHLDSFTCYPEKRFDVNNLVCLCVGCHKNFHLMYGNRKTTREQYQQFKLAELSLS